MPTWTARWIAPVEDEDGPDRRRPVHQLAGAARIGTETHTGPYESDGTLRTLLAQPVLDADGTPRAVLVGDLDETGFAAFTTAFKLGRTGEAVIRDAQARLVWRSGLGQPSS